MKHQHDVNTGRVVSVGQAGTVATHSSSDGRKLFVDFVGSGRWHVLATSIQREAEFNAVSSLLINDSPSCAGTPGICPHVSTTIDMNRARPLFRPAMSVSVLSVDPQVLLVRNFLTSEEIRTLIDMATARFRPSRLQHASDGATVSSLRNSSTADLGPPHAFHPRVRTILKGMSALTGEHPSPHRSRTTQPEAPPRRCVLAPFGSHSGELCLCAWLVLLQRLVSQTQSWPDMISHICLVTGKSRALTLAHIARSFGTARTRCLGSTQTTSSVIARPGCKQRAMLARVSACIQGSRTSTTTSRGGIPASRCLTSPSSPSLEHCCYGRMSSRHPGAPILYLARRWPATRALCIRATWCCPARS